MTGRRPDVLHVTGARPNFPKAAPVLAACAALGLRQLLVHTGQHYDDAMSEVFFRELQLPRPDVNLGVGSGTHAEQTAAIMVGLETLMVRRDPRLVVVYGDVNSTVAAALVAAKLRIPVAHVEAGLRSFDRTMPEEINRILTDRVADLLFATSPDAVAHLGNEGVPADRIHLVGNPMIDTLLATLPRIDSVAARTRHAIGDEYVVVTLHRPANVDRPHQAEQLVRALAQVAETIDLVLPLHPRGRAALESAGLFRLDGVTVTDPLPYTEFMGLVRGARAVITDSGGVQEETTMLGVPCLTLRPNTERPVTISHGTNRLCAPQTLAEQFVAARAAGDSGRRPPLWDGKAGPRIAEIVAQWLNRE